MQQEIKVGQVYKTPSGPRYIVTDIGTYNVYLLYDTGYCMEYPLSSMRKNYNDKLVAEYSSWKDAVNSKEFNDE